MRPDGITLVFLTRGKVAIIDTADADLILAHKWHAISKGYASRRIGLRGPQVMMHREILGLPITGNNPQGDHINRNRLDNRRCNLRIATPSQNAANTVGKRKSHSGFRGVHRASKARWKAMISVGGKNKHLGNFTSRDDAARAYDEAARQLYGEFAVLNFPDAA